MSKNIFKQKRRCNFTTIPNEALNDSNLSWKEKGLLCYLLSLPDDWQVYVSHLKTISTDGEDSVSSGLNGLIEQKYIWRRPRGGANPGGWEYYIFDSPENENPFLRELEIPKREIPDSDESASTKDLFSLERTKESKNESSSKQLKAPKLADDEFISELKRIHPRIDIDSELRKMDAWLLNNPARKKTRQFITNWLNRVQIPLATQQPSWKPRTI